MWPKGLQGFFAIPELTRSRVRLAYATAAVADAMQLLLGPLGWAGGDELIDVVAMFVTWRLLGFHPLLLPTFAVEFLPVVDLLPTWVGCVALVIARRKKQQSVPLDQAPPGTVIDI